MQIELDSIAQYLDVSGVNASQLAQLEVLTAAPASTNVVSGAVTRAATQGTLTYTGFLSLTTSAATFTLTGELGSATISVNGLQSLDAVRTQINSHSATTGVVAGGSGNTLTLTSAGYGSAAIVDVDVTSGTFNTAGGDGAGHAAGLDALATLNGQALSGDGNDVVFADSLGSYQLSLVAGYTGAISPITVTSANGTFDVTGGDPTGTS